MDEAQVRGRFRERLVCSDDMFVARERQAGPSFAPSRVVPAALRGTPALMMTMRS